MQSRNNVWQEPSVTQVMVVSLFKLYDCFSMVPFFKVKYESLMAQCLNQLICTYPEDIMRFLANNPEFVKQNLEAVGQCMSETAEQSSEMRVRELRPYLTPVWLDQGQHYLEYMLQHNPALLNDDGLISSLCESEEDSDTLPVFGFLAAHPECQQLFAQILEHLLNGNAKLSPDIIRVVFSDFKHYSSKSRGPSYVILSKLDKDQCQQLVAKVTKLKSVDRVARDVEEYPKKVKEAIVSLIPQVLDNKGAVTLLRALVAAEPMQPVGKEKYDYPNITPEFLKNVLDQNIEVFCMLSQLYNLVAHDDGQVDSEIIQHLLSRDTGSSLFLQKLFEDNLNL